MPPPLKALIAGATGATSKRLVELLAGDQQWQVVGVCRRPPKMAPDTVTYAAADLSDPRAVADVAAAHPDVTHIFYCCRAPHGETGVESVEANVEMLRGILDGVLAHASALQHVHLVEGGKWYGMHLGQFPTPALEDDPRHLPPNFYYDQEDFLRARAAEAEWTWTASRPNFITDFAPERPRNLIAVLACWAAFCRHFATPLDFPGRPAAFDALAEVTDATMLARAMRFVSTSPQCANQAFNVTNGEPIRWRRFWPELAELYRLPMGAVRPMQLGSWMADKDAAWQEMSRRHGLVEQPMSDVVLWPFADFALNQEHDVFYSMTKLRNAGFTEHVDTFETFKTQIGQYREARLIP